MTAYDQTEQYQDAVYNHWYIVNAVTKRLVATSPTVEGADQWAAVDLIVFSQPEFSRWANDLKPDDLRDYAKEYYQLL